MRSYVSHLECAYSGERFDRGIVHTISTIGKPIVVKYDLERLSKEITRSSIEDSKTRFLEVFATSTCNIGGEHGLSRRGNYSFDQT